MKHLFYAWIVPLFAVLKLFLLKIFFTTNTLFPLNLAGLPAGGNLLSSSGAMPGQEAFLLSARIQLSSAQLLALLATPVTIVPAPGL